MKEEEDEEEEDSGPFSCQTTRHLPNKKPERLPLKGLGGSGAVQSFLGLATGI